MAEPLVETLPEIGVTVVSSWIFNAYVVHDGGDGRPFVVDPGLVRNSEAVLHHLRHGLGLDLDPTDRERWPVAATHAHSDHVAGVPHLHQGAPTDLFLPGTVAAWAEGHRPRSPGPREVAHIAPVLRDQPFDREALRGLVADAALAGYGRQPYRMPVDAAGYLDDGDVVPGAPDWVALHTPGHTDDSTSYWCSATRTLLSGDAVLSVGRRAWFNPEYVDAEQATATEDRLRALPVEVLLPGHGRPCAGSDLWGDALGHDQRPPGPDRGLRRFLRRHRGA